MINIAILASGDGSNAENIIYYSKNMHSYRVSAIVTNNPQAGVIERARKLSIPYLITNDTSLQSTDFILKMSELGIKALILAGFLKKIPVELIHAFPILNIHPALLPKYGGKGMYGMHVHRSVIEHRELVSGITIHEVDEWYDHGPVLFQATCTIAPDETPESLAEKIHTLEHAHYPQVIDKWLQTRFAS